MLDSLCSTPIRNYLYSSSIFVFLGKHPALIREILNKALKQLGLTDFPCTNYVDHHEGGGGEGTPPYKPYRFVWYGF